MGVIPKALSKGEETFALHCQAYNLTPEREYVFAKGRKFRFDFAWPHYKVAVEIEGGTRTQGRHTRHSGFEADCRKYNLAVAAEWLVYRFTTEMVTSGEAITIVKEALWNDSPTQNPA